VETTHRFATVCLSYEQARREGELNTRKRCDEAYQEYAKEANDAQLNAQKRCEEAGQNYWSIVQKAESEEDSGEKVAEAYRNYQEAVRDAQEGARRRMEEADRNCIGKLHEARVSGQKLCQEAYRNYLRSVQELWSHMDVDALADAYALTSMNEQRW
jgi:hypothetical protein